MRVGKKRKCIFFFVRIRGKKMRFVRVFYLRDFLFLPACFRKSKCVVFFYLQGVRLTCRLPVWHPQHEIWGSSSVGLGIHKHFGVCLERLDISHLLTFRKNFVMNMPMHYSSARAPSHLVMATQTKIKSVSTRQCQPNTHQATWGSSKVHCARYLPWAMLLGTRRSIQARTVCNQFDSKLTNLSNEGSLEIPKMSCKFGGQQKGKKKPREDKFADTPQVNLQVFF